MVMVRPLFETTKELNAPGRTLAGGETKVGARVSKSKVATVAVDGAIIARTRLHAEKPIVNDRMSEPSSRLVHMGSSPLFRLAGSGGGGDRGPRVHWPPARRWTMLADDASVRPRRGWAS